MEKKQTHESNGRTWVLFILCVLLAVSAIMLSVAILVTELSDREPSPSAETTAAAVTTTPVTSAETTEAPVTTLPEGAIEVSSSFPGMTHLVPGEFDDSVHGDGTALRYYCYVYVGTVNGKLCVLSNHPKGNSKVHDVIIARQCRYDAFVGDADGVRLNGETILDAPCVGMIPSYNNDALMILTASAERSVIYTAERTETGWQLCDNTLTVDGKLLLCEAAWPNLFYTAREDIYLLTDKGITVLHARAYLDGMSDFDSVTTEEIAVPDWWGESVLTNVTRADDGTVFVGEQFGVIGIKDKTVTYYPIRYYGTHFSP